MYSAKWIFFSVDLVNNNNKKAVNTKQKQIEISSIISDVEILICVVKQQQQ